MISQGAILGLLCLAGVAFFWVRELQSASAFIVPTDQRTSVHATSPWLVGLLGGLSAFPIVISQSLYAYSAAATVLAAGVAFNHCLAPRARRYHPPPVLNRLTGACGVAVFAVAMSALINGAVPSFSTIPGLMALGLFLAAFSVSVRSEASAISGLVATSAAVCVAMLAFGPQYVRSSPEALWKYGLATPITLLAVSIGAKTWRHAPPLTLGLIGLGSIALGSRSHGAICLLAAASILLRRVFPASRALLLVVAPMIVYGAYLGLSSAISEGYFGSAIQEKMAWQQTQGDSILLVGRAEAILSLTVIGSHPFLGVGSARAIPPQDIQLALDHAATWGGIPISVAMRAWYPRSDDAANLHSIMLGAWVEGGILAVVPYVGLLLLFWVAATRATSRFAAIYVFMAIFSSWHLLFSPWSYGLVQMFAITSVGAALSIFHADQTVSSHAARMPRIKGGSRAGGHPCAKPAPPRVRSLTTRKVSK